MPMRYYEYLSTAKVDMLYPQIGQTSRSVGGEVGFDLKVIKASRKTDGKKEPTTYEKLIAIEEWIYNNEPVGSVDEPAPWISARLDLAESRVTARPDDGTDERSEAVLFAGRTKPGSYIVMGGSADHLVGGGTVPGLPTARSRRSSANEILAALKWSTRGSKEYRMGKALQRFAEIAEEADFDTDTELIQALADTSDAPMALVAESAHWMLRRRGRFFLRPVQHFEFFAKRLQTATIGGRSVTLATPLFVSLMD